MDDLWLLLLGLFGVVVAATGFLVLRKRLHRRRRALARADFRSRRGCIERQFFAAASTSGKPRGLRWKECRFQEGETFAIDRVSGALYALVGVMISFEAVEGGPMEDVEAVGNLRAATAVFVFQKGNWTTDGRAVFNLLPEETVQRFQSTLEVFE
jgi:hypothetical protein